MLKSPKIVTMGKSSEKAPVGPEAGRKAAYFARNRAALISATQVLLGEKGWNATIDEVAAHAGVSVSTVYKHFETKDLLFETCAIESWNEFEAWALQLAINFKDPLEQLVVPMRLMIRGQMSHPVLAQMLAKNVAEFTALVPLFTKNLGNHMRELVKAKVLEIDNPDLRIMNLKAVLIRVFFLQLESPKPKQAEADLALSLALPMIGISPAKAKALMELPLPI
jgi:AcrR family transcriptional regulator